MRITTLFCTVVILAAVGCSGAKTPTAVPPTVEGAAGDGPNVPSPPGVPQNPGEEDLLAELAPFGAYENSSGKKPGDPLHVSFRGKGLSDDDLGKMRPILLKTAVMVKLNLNGCERITDAGLAHLKELPALRVLWIESKHITDDGLKSLTTLTDLEGLSLSGGNTITNAGLAQVGKLTKLRKLSVYSKHVNDAGYAHLAGLVNLEEFHVGDIGNDLTDERLQYMKGMTKLKELTIRDKVTDAGMAHVKNMVGLQILFINSSKVTGQGLANLAPHTKLQKLTIQYASDMRGESLAFLAGKPELRELELNGFGFQFDKTAAGHVAKLTGLKKLSPGVVGEGGLEGIAGLTGLEELDLGKPNIYGQPGIRDDDMKHVAKLTSLQILYLGGTKVTDAGIKHLAGMPNLSSLFATENNITDASLPYLATIPKLDRLGLSDCKLTGSGLKELPKLPNLLYLWLNGNPITDEHVLALKVVPKLKTVYLTGTKVSDEKALELKKARPDLEVLDSAGDAVVLNKQPPAKPKRPVEDLTNVEAAFKFTAEEFYAECKADREKAVAKFKGKVIEVTGVVDSIHRDSDGDRSVTLKVDKEFLGVTCNTADEQPWVKVAKGQKITIKGKWPPFVFGASLADCVFVDVGVYAGIPLTAAALAKEFAADGEGTLKKYNRKSIVMTGEIVDKEYNSAGAATFTLKTDNKIKVKASFTAFDKDVSKPIKVGQTLKVVGELGLNVATGDTVDLIFCMPLP